MTWSILGRDSDGRFGVAVAGRFFAQALVNPLHGPAGLDRLEARDSAAEVPRELTATDDGHAQRQLHVLPASGAAVAFTGTTCVDWCGHRRTEGRPLAERLPAALAVGGWADAGISRVTDAFLACPFLILAIALAAFLGPSLVNAMVAIGISATPIFVRLSRAAVIDVKVEDYIEAARAVGNPPWRVAWRHVLPNIAAPVIVQASLAIAAAVIAEASLSFLGLGQQPPAPSWGSMLNSAKNYVDNAPWMAVWPGLAIFALVLAFNLLGDGLRDALDPRRR